MNKILAIKSISLPRINYFYFFNIFKIIAIISIITLSVFYVFQINLEISGRYLTREYERKISELLTETRLLETSFAQKGSLSEIMPILAGMNFQEPEKTHYIQILDHKVVVR